MFPPNFSLEPDREREMVCLHSSYPNVICWIECNLINVLMTNLLRFFSVFFSLSFGSLRIWVGLARYWMLNLSSALDLDVFCDFFLLMPLLLLMMLLLFCFLDEVHSISIFTIFSLVLCVSRFLSHIDLQTNVFIFILCFLYLPFNNYRNAQRSQATNVGCCSIVQKIQIVCLERINDQYLTMCIKLTHDKTCAW